MSAAKPTVYMDTGILSALHYRGGTAVGIRMRIRTQEWWEQERQFFEIFVSSFTVDELARGVFGAQEAALREARRLNSLQVVRSVREAALYYVDSGLIPPSVFVDAFQLAVATVHRMNYLLTWNQAHLVKVAAQVKLKELNDKRKWRTPWIVSPDTIPRVLLGQTIRRRDE